MEAWRREPPASLKDGGYELVDESFNSLTWEARYMDWPQKILVVCTLGFALLFKGFMRASSGSPRASTRRARARG